MSKIALVALLALTNLGARAQTAMPCGVHATDRAVRQVAHDFMDGYNRGDADAVASLYASDATYLTQHFVTGIVAGRDQIRAYVQRGVDAKFHIDEIKVLSVGCSNDFAYAITRYQSTNGGQNAFGVNLVVLRRAGKKWLIVAHESAVPDPATAIQTLAPAGR